MLIDMDDRETNVMMKELGEMEIMCYPKRLKTGDYVWKDVCIERKTMDDFCASMIDGRLRSQVERMKKEFKYNYVLVSGKISGRKGDMNENCVIGMLVSLVVKYNIKILILEDDRQLAYAIKRILERHEKMYDLEEMKGGEVNGK